MSEQQKNTVWPRKDLERVNKIIATNGDAPGGEVELYRALVTLPNQEIAESLLGIGTRPDQRTMEWGVFSRDAALMEKMILNGGPLTEKMTNDALRLRSPEMVNVLLKYGAPQSEETQRLAKAIKRQVAAGKSPVARVKQALSKRPGTLAQEITAAFRNARKAERKVRVNNVLRSVKSQLEV